jgi:HEAT repeat protein
VEDLIIALEDSEPNVRARAATALGRIGDEQAVLALRRLLDDDAEVAMLGRVGDVASLAIQRILASATE